MLGAIFSILALNNEQIAYVKLSFKRLKFLLNDGCGFILKS